MITVIKKHGKTIRAYRLGDSSPAIDELIESGKIVPLPDGKYEVMSQESVLGGSGHGQIACAGDYVKVDTDGFPYPNSAEFFETRHTLIRGDEYEQKPVPMSAWNIKEPMCPEIEFLQKEKGLMINREDFSHTFTAPLWGTIESAPGDSTIVFYSITFSENHEVIDAEFNFVVREVFDDTYSMLSDTSDQFEE